MLSLAKGDAGPDVAREFPNRPGQAPAKVQAPASTPHVQPAAAHPVGTCQELLARLQGWLRNKPRCRLRRRVTSDEVPKSVKGHRTDCTSLRTESLNTSTALASSGPSPPSPLLQWPAQPSQRSSAAALPFRIVAGGKKQKEDAQIEQDETPEEVHRLPHWAGGCCGPSWTDPSPRKD
ncbi:uncharacterized protein K444DRAFT_626424 [Hyaloscypha bicolor E]|uniref:Uncharacterized protein n=1 Tax=Hyaloscypha bicolor E TaxID=1095630 RepID=A0A2J6TLP7_9HELO|nr:uncharacterized protein K444DRAFT_626424 [Hyaloscypha bicolor E]PMD63944.1 hypothetical protein K444DRAFT_626424 [Hyaloscypha bicolor E]